MDMCQSGSSTLTNRPGRMEPPWQVSITKNEIFAILCHEGLGLFVTVGRHLKKKKKKKKKGRLKYVLLPANKNPEQNPEII